MIQKIYESMSNLCEPLWWLVLKRRARQGKEDPLRLPERWGISSRKRPPGSLIWIHAASVGESLSVLGLIDYLQQSFPSLIILITTGTRSSAGVLKNRLPSGVIHQMVPIDMPKGIQRFLDFWNPSLALFIESDLWPNLLSLTQRRPIPTLLLNGRISEKSLKWWKWFKPLLSPILKNFKTCLVSSQEQADRLKQLGATNVEVTGNLKFTTPLLSYDETFFKALQKEIGDRPVWCAASTHPGEERIIFGAHRQLLKDFPNLLLILAPRHPHRTDEIQKLAEDFKMASITYFDIQEKGLPPLTSYPVFLVDTLGDLGLFYRLSPLVFMGGSFVDVGGHNLIEPAQLGCAILHGPLMEKNQDILDAFTKAGASCLVHHSKDLVQKIKSLLKNPQQLKKMQEKSNELVLSHKKVLDKVVFILHYWIKR